MSTARKRILSAALLLPVVLFSTVWTSFALWRCRSDGQARSQCCCPTKATSASVRAEPITAATLSRQACCDFERHDVDRAPAEAAARSAAQLAGLIATALATFPLPALEAPAPRARDVQLAGDGPPAGRALLLQKQSLLI